MRGIIKFMWLFAWTCGRVDKFSKIGDICPRWRQYFWNTVGWRPAWLPFAGPAFAAVKRGRVQPTASGQSGTRHTVFIGKTFYCAPYIFVCHIILLWFCANLLNLYSDFMPNTPRPQQVPFPRNINKLGKKSRHQTHNKKLSKKIFDNYSWQITNIVLHFDSSKGETPATRGSGIQTPSYILSPLDSGPQPFLQFRMPISFSPFLPFRAFGNTAGQHRRRFFVVFTVQKPYNVCAMACCRCGV